MPLICNLFLINKVTTTVYYQTKSILITTNKEIMLVEEYNFFHFLIRNRKHD